jgi:small-conductance mechanosensitive channel
MFVMDNKKSTEEKVEQLKQDSEIQKALEQTAGSAEGPVEVPSTAKRTLFLGTYFVVLFGLGAFYYLIKFRVLGAYAANSRLAPRIILGAIAIVTVVAIAKALDVYLISRVENAASEYNIRRILRLVTALLILFIGITLLFANWYTAVVSFGLVSLILGFALQTPITSFIGWIYILIRTPYRVGDRIKMGDATGDVIDVGYLDTTLWEFGGEYLSTDHPSGRVIKFPNSKVLSSSVYNYSWPLFPYIWNEVKFYIAYESDLDYVEETMQRLAKEELGEAMLERVRTFRALLSETPVDEVEVREQPSVIFRVSNNTWLEAIVRYLVQPKQAGRVKTRLIKKMLQELNTAPDKVMFPRGPSR